MYPEKKEINLSDEQIISALRNNDDSVLNVLYKLYFGSVSHFVMSNNGNADDAKDIFQEAVIVFYQNIMDQNFDLQCKIKTYLYSVSRLMWLKKIKKNSTMVNGIADFSEYVVLTENESEAIEEKELLYTKMTHVLQELGEPCKTIIEDFYIHQLNMVEISEKFGYTNADNAKTQKYKCLMRLKKLFFKHEEKLKI